MRIWPVLLLTIPLAAQTPVFEVASVRVAGEGTRGGAICGQNTGPEAAVSGPESVLVAGGNNLLGLISEAYKDVVGGFDFPQWIRGGSRMAVSVKVPPNTTAAGCREMLRNLLAERFRLVTDVETRELAHFYLKVAKSGLKLKQADSSAEPKNPVMTTPTPGYVHYTFKATPIGRIVNNISNYVVIEANRTGLVNDPSYRIVASGGVIDETGLSGNFDGSFDFYSVKPQDENPELLQDALVRQLGLTLELRREPGKVLVIRSGERTPIEN